MKILITGGHLTPAVALIDRIGDLKDRHDIIFVGRKYALDHEQTLSLEYKEITKRGIPFIALQAGRLTRVVSLRGLFGIFNIPLGFIHAFGIIRKENPDIVFSFGGYIALPVACMAWILKKPVFTHEQTIAPGLANRIIAFFSRKVFYSFPEAKQFFPKKKAIFSGNPIRKSVFIVDKKPFEISSSHPVVYITGGSLGSHSINDHIHTILNDLLKHVIVIHQTGDVKEYNDYQHLMRLRRSMPEELKNRYFLAEHFFDYEIGYVYSVVDVIVGRAGANTFFEAIHLQKPAVFIPLPWSAHKEQQKHADFFVQHNIGEVFEQKESSQHLFEIIMKVVKNRTVYKRHFKELSLQMRREATDVIIQEILAT